MAAHANTIPELDRRLREQRAVLAQTADDLRRQVRQDLHRLNPRQQLQRHPEVALAAASLAGLMAGMAVARLAGHLFAG